MMETLKHNDSGQMPDDAGIVDLYWQRDENAIRLTELKYKNYLLTVAYHIVHDSLDCEECLNDTYLGAWNAMPQARPDCLRAFLTTIMRRTAVNRYHSKQKKGNVPSEMTVALAEVEDILTENQPLGNEFDAHHFGALVSEYLRALPERDRYIFMSRYYAVNTVDRIAGELFLSRSTVNKTLARIRAGLKEKLEKEGYAI